MLEYLVLTMLFVIAIGALSATIALLCSLYDAIKNGPLGPYLGDSHHDT